MRQATVESKELMDWEDSDTLEIEAMGDEEFAQLSKKSSNPFFQHMDGHIQDLLDHIDDILWQDYDHITIEDEPSESPYPVKRITWQRGEQRMVHYQEVR